MPRARTLDVPLARSAALIVLDGLGDRPDPATGRPSPIEAARTPHLDRLSVAGEVGAVSILGPGVAPESDAGVFALLGYDPVHDSPGRGVLEAMGSTSPSPRGMSRSVSTSRRSTRPAGSSTPGSAGPSRRRRPPSSRRR